MSHVKYKMSYTSGISNVIPAKAGIQGKTPSFDKLRTNGTGAFH